LFKSLATGWSDIPFCVSRLPDQEITDAHLSGCRMIRSGSGIFW
jgi:hypothetical protein